MVNEQTAEIPNIGPDTLRVETAHTEAIEQNKRNHHALNEMLSKTGITEFVQGPIIIRMEENDRVSIAHPTDPEKKSLYGKERFTIGNDGNATVARGRMSIDPFTKAETVSDWGQEENIFSNNKDLLAFIECLLKTQEALQQRGDTLQAVPAIVSDSQV